MDPLRNISEEATCTTCTFTEDFSNYWTAVLFFRHRNGSYHRVSMMENLFLEGARGGMTVYYTAPYDKKTKVTAFRPVSPAPFPPRQRELNMIGIPYAHR